MKYQWLEETKTCEELSQELGINVKSITRGHIIIGSENVLDEYQKPIQLPITKQGIEIEFENETPEIIDKLDLELSDLKREGGRTLREAIVCNLDITLTNPQKEAYKLSQLYGLTHEQLDTYIDNNMTDLQSAREIFRKALHVILWLVKQTKLDE